MKGYLTYFFEQHKRLVVSYAVILVIALVFAVSLKTTAVPASVTMLYVSIFATLAPVASLTSDRVSYIEPRLNMPEADPASAAFLYQ